ncbi:hypothetical protein [Serratia fonticola]
MNKTAAKTIAEDISREQLAAMFDRAKREVKDWRQVSNVNPGMTKGTAWNILYRGFIGGASHRIAVTNMIREFGEFLPDQLKPAKKPKRAEITPHHEEPIFEVNHG